MSERVPQSLALRAHILVALDNHMHHWCTLDWLARRLALDAGVIRPIADALVEEGAIDCSQSAYGPMYGVDIEPGLALVT